jgi:hypothetical protein
VVLSSLIGAIKSQRAAAALDRFGSVYWGKDSRTLWSSGFFLCSVGGDTLEILKQYIETGPLIASSITYPPSTEGLRDRIRSGCPVVPDRLFSGHQTGRNQVGVGAVKVGFLNRDGVVNRAVKGLPAGGCRDVVATIFTKMVNLQG